jgi:hypothetical protein
VYTQLLINRLFIFEISVFSQLVIEKSVTNMEKNRCWMQILSILKIFKSHYLQPVWNGHTKFNKMVSGGGIFQHRLADRFLLSSGIFVLNGIIVALVVLSLYISLHTDRHTDIRRWHNADSLIRNLRKKPQSSSGDISYFFTMFKTDFCSLTDVQSCLKCCRYIGK